MSLAEIRPIFHPEAVGSLSSQLADVAPAKKTSAVDTLKELSSDCTKKEKKETFKGIFDELMSKHPYESYEGKLKLVKQTVLKLEDSVDQKTLNSLRRSMSARVGMELGKLKRDIAGAVSNDEIKTYDETPKSVNKVWGKTINEFIAKKMMPISEGEKPRVEKRLTRLTYIKVLNYKNWLGKIINDIPKEKFNKPGCLELDRPRLQAICERFLSQIKPENDEFLGDSDVYKNFKEKYVFDNSKPCNIQILEHWVHGILNRNTIKTYSRPSYSQPSFAQ